MQTITNDGVCIGCVSMREGKLIRVHKIKCVFYDVGFVDYGSLPYICICIYIYTYI